MTEAAKRAGRRAGARTGRGGTAAAAPPQAEPETEPKAEPRTEERLCQVPFCPIGLTLGVLQGAAPEATVHLIRAAQELLLAVRAVIDERAKEAGEGPAEHLERIEIS
jgi:hypothetical protein